MKSFFGALLRGFDLARRVFFNLVFLALLVFLLSLLFTGGEPPVEVEDGVALLVDPYGVVVEDYDTAPLDRALQRLVGDDVPQVRLRDLRDALKFAADDDRIEAVVLDLGGLAPVQLSKLDELAQPLAAARANGKRVLVYADAYEQSRYFLAAHADEVFLHPMGGVLLEGYAQYRVYMKEALDKLSIDWHVFKAGDFKSYGEPFERNDMSPQVRGETIAWLGDLWGFYRQRVESARGLEAGAVDAYIEGLVDGVRAARGDLAVYAEAAGLVDVRDDYTGFSERVAALVGTGADGEGFNAIGWRAYLGAARQERAADAVGRDKVAVLVASGEIVDGDPGVQAVGSDRIGEMLARAADDERVKALVLRIDSPGGSAFASEEIRADLMAFRDSGRPLVVSMSSVAASGGYWIAMAGDEVWASPATITGSIGVIAMFPTFPRTMQRLGLNTDGVATTPLAGELRPDRPLGEQAATLVQLLVDGVYSDFVDLVSEARAMDGQAVLALAGGRVYSGAMARELDLVDELGGLDEAVAAAAAAADLERYRVQVLEQPLSLRDRMLLNFLENGAVTRAAAALRRPALPRWLGWFERELDWLARFDDPRKAYLYCLCSAP